MQKDILRESNNSSKVIPNVLPRIDVNAEVSGPGGGKIRYIGGYVVAELKYRNAKKLRNVLFVMSRVDEINQSESKKILLDSLGAYNLCESEDPESLIDTRRRQILQEIYAMSLTVPTISLLNYSPVGTPGFKPRIRPPYPQRVVKGD